MPPRAKKADPFAGTADEAQNDTPKTNEEKPVVSNETVPTEVSATFKGDGTFGSPWVVVRAGSPAELNAILDTDEFEGLLQRTHDRGSEYADLFPAQESKPAGGGAPSPQSAPNGETRSCKHGAMTFRSGTNAQGKPWQGFFCPTPKGTVDQCKPEFLR